MSDGPVKPPFAPSLSELLAALPRRIDQVADHVADPRPTPPQIFTAAGWRPLYPRRRK
ncbi:MAG: hypothetical protein KF842_06820 [Caulobacter sp.]|nr:hypothetical protein [Caulobacter sp.]